MKIEPLTAALGVPIITVIIKAISRLADKQTNKINALEVSGFRFTYFSLNNEISLMEFQF